MDDFETKEALLDQGEIDNFLALVESCDSEETQKALEDALLKDD